MARHDRRSRLRGHLLHRLDRDLKQYVIRDEQVVVAVRQHWVAHIKPFAAAGFGLILALYVDITGPRTPGGQVLSQGLWLLWLASLVWLGWDVLNWRRDWFVATDKRFLMFYGFIHRKVAMMPLVKVTDLTFNRSLLGRLLGYGDFTLESAGQHQALGHIEYIPDADHHYREICTVLFADHEGGEDDRDDDEGDVGEHGGGGRGSSGEGRDGHGGPGGPRRPGGPVGPAGSDDPSGWPDDPTGWSDDPGDWVDEDAYAVSDARAFGLPVHPSRRPRRDPRIDDRVDGTQGDPAGEYVYRSSDLVREARRADTAEIPVVTARPLPPPPPRRPRNAGSRHTGRSGGRSTDEAAARRAPAEPDHTDELLYPPGEWFDRP